MNIYLYAPLLHSSRDTVSPGHSTVKLFVGGLRKTHTEEQLKRYFETKYGPIVDCYIGKDSKTKESRCFGFVTFKESQHANRALTDLSHFIEGAPIHVRPYKLNDEENKRSSTVSYG